MIDHLLWPTSPTSSHSRADWAATSNSSPRFCQISPQKTTTQHGQTGLVGRFIPQNKEFHIFCLQVSYTMADSPLSITANVTGILTFFAAILAFIYVRYNVIRNGHNEMIDIFKSVSSFIAETSIIAKATESEDHIRSDPLKELVTDMLKTEIGVMEKCMIVLNVDAAHLPSDSSSHISHDELFQLYQNIIVLYLSALHRWLQSPVPNMAWSILNRFTDYLEFVRGLQEVPFLWSVAMRVTSFGVTPVQLRWYRVRDSVREMIQRRETLRSQLLFCQMSLMIL